MPPRVEPDDVIRRLHAVRTRVREIRGDDRVAIVAVTKSLGVEAWAAAAAAGCDAIGENYAQELLGKWERCGGAPPLPVHFIGAVQTNKIRTLVRAVDLWQGLDRTAVIEELGKRWRREHNVARDGNPVDDAPEALLQVNTTAEASKSGCRPDEIDGLLESARTSGVTVRGLMTIGPTRGDRDARRGSFMLLRRLADERGLEQCSMGMSEDYEDAVECGSTMLRLGTALFGPRR